ncbi:MAG: T9SS type A sorting domain-containing protein [Ignavibacteria bacterium]|jgi:hypothetical protein|nr:T9SS type A sorting domain-containing protein [Ignavibacteria bacterium]
MNKKYIILLIALAISINTAFASDYEVEPNVSNCTPGRFSAEAKTRIMKFLNDLRAHHKLAPITWDDANELLPQSAALSMAVTAKMQHTPTPGKCTTWESDSGRSQSNLMMGYRSGGKNPTVEEDIIGWLIDDNNAGDPTTVGHRRLVFNPFLVATALGHVDAPHPTQSGYTINTGAFWGITDDAMGKSGCENDFVAYPYENYPPAWVNKTFYLSFSPIPDATNWWSGNNAVNFQNAKITMTDSVGTNVAVSDIHSDNVAWGCFQHNIVWKAAGLKDSVRYNVKISGILVKGVAREYEYWFKLTNAPIIPPADLAGKPALVSPANQSKDIEAPVTFKWKKADNAIYYSIIGSLSKDLYDTNFFATGWNDTLCTLTTPLSNNNTYYWKVTAYNIDSIPTDSDVWTFDSKEILPDPPTTIYPTANATNIARKVEFTWNMLDEAAYYNLQIATTAEFKTSDIVVDQEEITVPTYKLTDAQTLNAFSTYYWRINATVASGNSTNWTAPLMFATNDVIDGIENTIDDATIFIAPNPFSQSTTLSIDANSMQNAKVEIYDILGVKLANVFDGKLSIGKNYIQINKLNKSNDAIYFCKITIGNKQKSIVLFTK